VREVRKRKPWRKKDLNSTALAPLGLKREGGSGGTTRALRESSKMPNKKKNPEMRVGKGEGKFRKGPARSVMGGTV